MPVLPFAERLGVEPFLTPRTLELLTGLHRHHLQRVNHSISGTELASLPLYQLVQKTHQNSAHARLHHYASQAWNMDFWLQGLTPASGYREPLPVLRQAIERDFGSWDAFVEQFGTNAEAMVASGWTWLVKRPSSGRLAILNTYNGGSPMHVTMRNPLAPRESPESGLSAMLGLKRPASSDGGVASFGSAAAAGSSAPAGDGSSGGGGDALVPVLGLNMWEHAWIQDYGLFKEEYIRTFWKCVNWSRVAVILNIY